MKIKFNSDDNLRLNKPLKFHAMTIIIRSVFEEGSKLYSLCMNYKNITVAKMDVLEGIETNKTSASKECMSLLS